MPLETPAETAEASRLRSELYAAQEQLATIQAEKIRTTKTAALEQALGGIELQPGSKEQLAQLLDRELIVHKDEQGNTQVVGPGLKPLNEHLATRLQAPEFQKFIAGRSGPTLPLQRGTTEALGDYLARQHQATTPHTDPRMDMSRGFGLGRGPTTPFAQQRDDGRARR